jgi:uncharacterized protein (UPF0335 family)
VGPRGRGAQMKEMKGMIRIKKAKEKEKIKKETIVKIMK